MKARFNRIGAQLCGLAKRLGKSEPLIVINDGAVRLPPTRLGPLWASFSHLIRNIVDHGFDDADARVSAGKLAQVKVELSAKDSPAGVTIIISDDGRGIDWEKVRSKAAQKGLANVTRADLVTALLSSGFSTAETMTSTSGRGVGMCAVATAVAALGGKLAIDSEPGKGTNFTIALGRVDGLMDMASPRLSMRPLSSAPQHSRPSNLPHLTNPDHVVIPADAALPFRNPIKLPS